MKHWVMALDIALGQSLGHRGAKFPALGKSVGPRGCIFQYIPPLSSVRIQYVAFTSNLNLVGFPPPNYQAKTSERRNAGKGFYFKNLNHSWNINHWAHTECSEMGWIMSASFQMNYTKSCDFAYFHIHKESAAVNIFKTIMSVEYYCCRVSLGSLWIMNKWNFYPVNLYWCS